MKKPLSPGRVARLAWKVKQEESSPLSVPPANVARPSLDPEDTGAPLSCFKLDIRTMVNRMTIKATIRVAHFCPAIPNAEESFTDFHIVYVPGGYILEENSLRDWLTSRTYTHPGELSEDTVLELARVFEHPYYNFAGFFVAAADYDPMEGPFIIGVESRRCTSPPDLWKRFDQLVNYVYSLGDRWG